MAPLSRALALAIVLAHSAVAVAPCAGIAAVPGDPPNGAVRPAAAPGTPGPHGVAGHAEAAAHSHPASADAHTVAASPAEECGGHEEGTPTRATAPCPCGCDAGSAPGTPGSRIGFALWVVAPAPVVATPPRDFAALVMQMPSAPPDRRDPVPI
jgi:hypothetical protein